MATVPTCMGGGSSPEGTANTTGGSTNGSVNQGPGSGNGASANNPASTGNGGGNTQGNGGGNTQGGGTTGTSGNGNSSGSTPTLNANGLYGGTNPLLLQEQWPDHDGFCGELATQLVGLYHGAWIDEGLVRTVGGGEFLLGTNTETQALTTLHFKYTDFPSGSGGQGGDFGVFWPWIDNQLFNAVPVIFGAMVSDCAPNCDPEYDHIMAAGGHNTMSLNQSNIDDQILYWNHYSTALMTRSFASLSATRQSCSSDTVHGGCIPNNTANYAAAVSGLEQSPDQMAAHLDNLQVSTDNGSTFSPMLIEPEQGSTGVAASALLTGTLHVQNVTAGTEYAVLTYTYQTYPTSGTAASLLANNTYSSKTTFTPTASGTYDFTPAPWQMASSQYFVAVPVQ